jgi:hypothetical protein
LSETISQNTNTEITNPGSFNEFIEKNNFSSYTEAVEAHAKAVEEHQIALRAIGEVINLQNN